MVSHCALVICGFFKYFYKFLPVQPYPKIPAKRSKSVDIEQISFLFNELKCYEFASRICGFTIIFKYVLNILKLIAITVSPTRSDIDDLPILRYYLIDIQLGKLVFLLEMIILLFLLLFTLLLLFVFNMLLL